jgi:hypothetical protein
LFNKEEESEFCAVLRTDRERGTWQGKAETGTGRGEGIIIIKESSCLVLAIPSNKAITNVAR